MPTPIMSREEILNRLLSLFRASGYQGTSMSMISKETGLGKASLYHHFPGGKEQMVADVVEYVGGLLQENIIEPLKSKGTPQEKLDKMIDNVESFYAKGKEGCILESLSLCTGSDLALSEIRSQMLIWIKAMADLSTEVGIPKAEAMERAEQAMVSIQGSLIVARATGDQTVFQKSLGSLPDLLLKR